METLQSAVAELLEEQFARDELNRMISEFSVEDWQNAVRMAHAKGEAGQPMHVRCDDKQGKMYLLNNVAAFLDYQLLKSELNTMLSEFELEDYRVIARKTVGYDETPENEW
jgi:hypothetical protein